MDLEQSRKDAKRLARAWSSADASALARGREVLGDRFAHRRALGDAQHVIAIEHGYRCWPELVAAERKTGTEPPSSSASKQVVVTGHEYGPGDPVSVEVIERERVVTVRDRGAAAAKAGLRPGWRAVADELEWDLVVNISRSGVVWLPIVRVGPPLEEIIERIAYASLSLYQDLLELER